MDTSTCLLSIPPEIITTIASYLPLTSVLQLAATNRCLRELIFDASALWKELCLVRECRIYDFSDEHVGSLIRNFSLNACNAVRQVDLSNAGPNITNQTLELILTHFPNIHTLRLNRCVNLTPSSIVELLVSLTEPSRAPRLHLPHLTHLYLQDDRRDAAHIALGNKVTLATIRMRLAQLAGRPTSPSEGDAFEICDLELCEYCYSRYAGETLPCTDCNKLPYKNLCFVCQSFCDGCHAQYCWGCIWQHCRAVDCMCLLGDQSIFCFCGDCQAEFCCAVCGSLKCEGHLRRCVSCSSTAYCIDCIATQQNASQDGNTNIVEMPCTDENCPKHLCKECFNNECGCCAT